MKNAANCVNQCELQDTLIIDTSNAHGGPGLLSGPRSVEGRFLRKCAVSSIFDVASGSRFSFFLPLPFFLTLSALFSTFSREPGRFRDRFLGSTGVPFPWRKRVWFWLWVGPCYSRRGKVPVAPRSNFRPRLERDDPLNLSILLRGGKENNDDSLSKGD